MALGTVHPDDVRHVLAAVEEAWRTSNPYTMDYRVVWPDGTVRRLSAVGECEVGPGGTRRRMVGVVRDVTQEKESEATIQRTLADRDRALARYHLIFDRMPTACLVADADARIVEWNPAAERIFGFGRGDAVGRRWRDVGAPADVRPVVDDRVARLLAGEAVERTVYQAATKDGRTVRCEWHSSPLADDAGRVTGYLSMGIDVTAREAAQAEAARTQKLLNDMGRVAEIGGWELQVAAGRPTWWSDEVRRIHEVETSDDMTAEQALAFYPEPGRTELSRALADSIATGRPYDLELPFDSATGRRLWVRVSCRADVGPDGVPTRLYGSFQNVSAFHQAQAALLASEERFRALVEKSSDGIFLFDAGGRIAYATPSVRAMLGRRPEDMVGRRFASFLHPDDVAAADAAFATADATGGQPVPRRLRYRHADGSYRVLAVVWSDRRADPAVRAVVSNFRDVTEREQLEDQLRQAQKLEAVGRLAGGVAHDFNTLLTAILGFGDLALTRMVPGDPARGWVEEMVRAGRRGANLTRQLLAFSRKQVTRPRVLDLAAAVDGVAVMLRQVTGDGIDLRFERPPDLWAVAADPGQVEQVVLNLVVNARDAVGSGGGRVTVRTENIAADRRPPDAPADAPAGDYVVLSVADTGCGMDEATRARAFEPFFTTKGPDTGTGLGLATVYGIAKHAGGFVTIRSEVGRGTTFRVYFPRTHDAVEPDRPAEPATAVPAPSRGNGETVLLVEDDDSVRALGKYALEEAGYRVIEAADGPSALAAAAEPSADVLVLVTDVVMPGMSGREVADRIVRDRTGVRVLFLSGYPDGHFGHLGTVGDDVAFLQKPFLPAALVQRVRELLDAPARSQRPAG